MPMGMRERNRNAQIETKAITHEEGRVERGEEQREETKRRETER